ncbi:MAG: hypothetical protein JRN68_08280 [Nitrososphaerota archaeon]|nr:hypothetical protein [Nitrososphaerota archaeon]
MQGMMPSYAQGARRLKEYDQLRPHITREQYLNLLNAVERKYSSAGQWAKSDAITAIETSCSCV